MAKHRRSQGQDRRQDSYSKRAQREGYPARSVYKLEEIDRRLGLFRKGQRVLDLGASPGSWTLYAAKQVGPQGKVIGIDIQDHKSNLPPNATIEVRDIWDVSVAEFDKPFDVVMSDMAPNTSGQRHADQFNSYELFMQALEIAQTVLKPGGFFVGKIFQGAEFPDAQAAVRKAYTKVRVIRPKATRDISYEVFLIGVEKKAPVANEANDVSEEL